MSRPSNRTAVIEAAMRVAEADGLAAVTIDSVTIDSVAVEAGMTKAGLLYHFQNRRLLVEGIYAHLAEKWERDMLDALGKPFGDATQHERLTAYLAVAGPTMTRAELLYVADAGADSDLFAPWAEVEARWVPEMPTASSTEQAPSAEVWALIARLAADGLWSYEAVAGSSLPSKLREQIVRELIGLVVTPPR